MGKSKGGRNKGGPSRSAAKKGGGRSGGKAASALLKRGRGAKVLRAARGALGVRSGGGSTGNPKLKARYALSKGGAKNNSDIARGYAALEERLVGSNSVEMSRKRKAELRAKIKEAMRRNMCPELRRATSSREQAKLASAPSTDELMALMSQMTHDPSAPRPPVPTPGSPHRAFARGELAFSNNFKPPPPPEVTAGSGSRFSLLADDDDNEAGGAAVTLTVTVTLR